MIDVLLVDDHKIMRDGLKAILRSHTGYRIAGEAASGHEAVLDRKSVVEGKTVDIGGRRLN